MVFQAVFSRKPRVAYESYENGDYGEHISSRYLPMMYVLTRRSACGLSSLSRKTGTVPVTLVRGGCAVFPGRCVCTVVLAPVKGLEMSSPPFGLYLYSLLGGDKFAGNRVRYHSAPEYNEFFYGMLVYKRSLYNGHFY